MEINENTHHAKRALSGRLLSAGIRRGPEAHLMAMSVEAAVANAGANTHAVGIGRKVINGKLTEQICIRVHVQQKIATSLIPPQHLIPAFIDNIPTDVVESAPAMILAPTEGVTETENPKGRMRPILGGVSAAQFEVTAGTLSCICRSTREGDDPSMRYVLSNNHVFADVNRAQLGDQIYQQSPLDGGTSADTIARLTRFVPLKLTSGEANKVDGAIAAIMPGVEIDYSVANVGPVLGLTEATVNMKICKSGRTSGYTEGMVTEVGYDAIVGMDHTDSSVRAVFHDQLRVEATSPYPAIGLGGDSGSLVMERTGGNAVGLYFAGPQSGVYGIANPIDEVLSQLEIELM